MLITLLTCDLFAVNIILLTYGVVYHPCYFDDFDVSLCGVVPRYASAVAWAQHICGDTLTKCFFFRFQLQIRTRTYGASQPFGRR